MTALWPLPITFDSIVSYARIYGITDTDSFDDFAYFIRSIDDVYLEFMRDIIKAQVSKK